MQQDLKKMSKNGGKDSDDSDDDGKGKKKKAKRTGPSLLQLEREKYAKSAGGKKKKGQEEDLDLGSILDGFRTKIHQTKEVEREEKAEGADERYGIDEDDSSGVSGLLVRSFGLSNLRSTLCDRMKVGLLIDSSFARTRRWINVSPLSHTFSCFAGRLTPFRISQTRRTNTLYMTLWPRILNHSPRSRRSRIIVGSMLEIVVMMEDEVEEEGEGEGMTIDEEGMVDREVEEEEGMIGMVGGGMREGGVMGKGRGPRCIRVRGRVIGCRGVILREFN